MSKRAKAAKEPARTAAKSIREMPEEYPAKTDSNDMARKARTRVNAMSEAEVEQQAREAMARIYGGKTAKQAAVG
jgi:hypothetical protein